MYGKELILDLRSCEPEKFSRTSISQFFWSLCEVIDMVREDLHFWDDEGVPEEDRETEPHLVGVSAIQFIRTSNITIHTLPLLKEVYINVFSCKDFDPETVRDFAAEWFGGKVRQWRIVQRG